MSKNDISVQECDATNVDPRSTVHLHKTLYAFSFRLQHVLNKSKIGDFTETQTVVTATLFLII
jgi:hypothetical protein